jgi:hypothetical protein
LLGCAGAAVGLAVWAVGFAAAADCATTNEAAETLLTLEIALIDHVPFQWTDRGFTEYGYVVDRPNAPAPAKKSGHSSKSATREAVFSDCARFHEPGIKHGT